MSPNRIFLVLILAVFSLIAYGQNGRISGKVTDEEGKPLEYATIRLEGTSMGAIVSGEGMYVIRDVPAGDHTILVSFLGYMPEKRKLTIRDSEELTVDFSLLQAINSTDEIVVTGTMKEVKRLESPVPVEVYNPVFFKKNPTPNIYEALQNVNGVRPQLNCQVCNTGDIHINGLEGAYTMVLIDGMPIVSSLATVYGLSGIPNSLVERVEIVKGPASSLYGSEAIGGLINIITKNPVTAPMISADIMTTSWLEHNAALGMRFNLGDNLSVLTGINYFKFDQIIDNNDDNFTDIALQNRVSVFQKWNIKRKTNRLFTLAGRYYWEDRWGGELDWTPEFRGGDQIYGESITTRRWELIGQYQLPTTENLMLSFSFNEHYQNSVYGDVSYIGDQKIAFTQLTWDPVFGKHDLLVGSALRYTYYDDNTPATGGEITDPNNDPDVIWLPGIFIQDEIQLDRAHKLLLGMRYDHNNNHGNIFTPRLAYKWSITENDILRINAGTGFRVVNLFTEDHAALTGAREVVIAEELEPERSYNANVNYMKKWYRADGGSINVELSAFYTYFTNVILPDYETNTNQIIYDNLDGSAETKGISLNADMSLASGWSFILGATLMDVSSIENGVRQRQILTEQFTGTWSISYRFLKNKLSVDYTGNIYGPMLLPVLGPLDQRPEESPWWSIQNIQLSYTGLKNIELYGGVKNLLNWTPWKNMEEPIIARSFDPFDRGVDLDNSGNVIPTPNNPNALTFDPSYVYAPNQGIRAFFGIRYSLR